MSTSVARTVVVRGRVQGVFYRDSCRQEAERAGVSGWVSNEPDGSVRALLEGAPDAVERVVGWMRTGPPHASVDEVRVEEADAEGSEAFEVR
jgi:acylphosphatase